MNLTKTIFGNNPIFEYNTEIGGVGLKLTTKQKLAGFLAININTIRTFRVIDTTVQCFITSNYTLQNAAFSLNLDITYFYDYQGMVNKVGGSSFYKAGNLTAVSLPGLTSITTDYLFIDCVSLVNIDLPNIITISGASNFSGCTALVSINLDKVTHIGKGFDSCINLIEISLPVCVQITDTALFIGCKKLAMVYIPLVERIPNQTFQQCIELTNVYAPLLNSIGNSAFYGCIKIETLTVEKIKLLEDKAFYGCTLFKGQLFSDGDWPELLNVTGNEVFALTKISKFKANKLLTMNGNNIFYNSQFLTTVICTSVTSITGFDTFSRCINLVNVELPKLEGTIRSLFNSCSSLLTIDLPLINQMISTFSNCNKLVSVNSPVVTNLEGTFQYCYALTTLTLQNVDTISSNCFLGTSALKSIDLPKLKNIHGNSNFSSSGTLLINLPLLNIAHIGITTTNNNNFQSLNANCIINIPVYYLTNNNGEPDADFDSNLTGLVNYIGYTDPKTYNTELVGGAIAYNTRQLISTKLGISTAKVPNLLITGNNVKFTVTSKYKATYNYFYTDTNIREYQDNAGKLTELVSSSFQNSAVTRINLPGITSITSQINNVFASNKTNRQLIYLPNLTTITVNNLFAEGSVNNQVKRIYLGNVTSVIGTSASVNNGNFNNLNQNSVIYVHISQATINNGEIEEDLITHLDNYGIVRFIENYTIPNPVTDLRLGFASITMLSFDFTTPASLNYIEFYEVYVNGYFYTEIYGAFENIFDLNPNTDYEIEIVTVDMYFNRSVRSNKIIVRTAKPVAYYKMNQNFIDSVNRYNGNGSSMSFVGIGGRVGYAASFSGTSSKIELPAVTDFNLTKGTISCWVKIPNANSGYRGIVVKKLAYGIFIIDNILAVYDWGRNQIISTGVNIVGNNVWKHIAITFVSGIENGLQIYYNGNYILLDKMTVNSQANRLHIGYGDVVGQSLNGLMDEVIILDYVSSLEEIQKIYALGSASKELTIFNYRDYLLSYYKFDNTLVDSVSSYDMTNAGNVVYATGKVGNCAAFNDDVNGFCTIPVKDNLSFTDGTKDIPFSVIFSVKFVNLKNQWFISKRDTNENNNEWQVIYYLGKLGVYLYSEGSSLNVLAFDYTWTPTLETWYNIGFSYNGNGLTSGVKLFINGVSVGTGTTFGIYKKMNKTTSNVTVGSAGFNNTRFRLNAKLDCLGIFRNYALNDVDALDISNQINKGVDIV